MTRDFIRTEPARGDRSGEETDSFDSALRAAVRLGDSALERALPPQPGDLVGDKYLVHELIGAGGMGAVFRATHTLSGKEVALKWLLPSTPGGAARLLREARAAARIDHPNVVDVYDIGTHRGGHFLVMELLRGQSLGARLRASRLQPSELAAIMIPTLRGLAAAHMRGVIHRDLKPDNVFLCAGPDGSAREPKVLDFGISKLQAWAEEPEHLTKEGVGLGTPAYMSPEQLADAPRVDARTDIYAAGVIMYEALTGRLPFRADNYGALVLAISAQRPIPLRTLQPRVPAALERIVVRAMAKRPEDRYPNVESLIQALLPWSEHDAACATWSRLELATHARTQTRFLAWMPLGLVLAAFAWVGSAYGVPPPRPRATGVSALAGTDAEASAARSLGHAAWADLALRQQKLAPHEAPSTAPAAVPVESPWSDVAGDVELACIGHSTEAASSTRRTSGVPRTNPLCTAVPHEAKPEAPLTRRPVKPRAGTIYLADL